MVTLHTLFTIATREVNLISATRRASLVLRYRSAVLAVLLLALACAVTVGALLTLPAYFFVHAEADQANDYVVAAEAIAADRVKTDARQALSGFTMAVELLNASHTPPALAHTMTLVTEPLPRGVYLTKFSSRAETDGAVLTIDGVAGTRAALIAYARALRAVPQLSEVTVPVDDLVAGTEAPFTVTLRWTRPPAP